MPFQRPTLAELQARTEADVRGRMGLSALLQNSVLKVLANVFSGAVHLVYGFMVWVAKQVMPDTAELEHLDRWADIWGVTRTAATFTKGSVTFTGLAGSSIPAGTKVRRADGVEFEVDIGVVFVTTSIAANVTAVTAGAAGNTDSGTEVTLVSPISGVDSTATAGALTGGADQEGDDALRARMLKRIQEPPHGGAEHDYEQWALSISDVTRAWVFPEHLGVGTVGVTFVVDDLPTGPIPDAAKVTEVQDYLDTVRPVTADATAFAPTAVPLNPQITLTPNTAEVQAAVEASLEDMVRRDAVPGGTILVSHLREAISIAAGETNHVLNSPSADVTHTTGQLATLGTITWLP